MTAPKPMVLTAVDVLELYVLVHGQHAASSPASKERVALARQRLLGTLDSVGVFCQPKMPSFDEALAEVVNRYSRECESDTADFILATYMAACLDAFTTAVRQRDASASPLSATSGMVAGNDTLAGKDTTEAAAPLEQLRPCDEDPQRCHVVDGQVAALGRIVRYVPRDPAYLATRPRVERAAVIIGVQHEKVIGVEKVTGVDAYRVLVDLEVLGVHPSDQSRRFIGSAPFSADCEQGTWHWPPVREHDRIRWSR